MLTAHKRTPDALDLSDGLLPVSESEKSASLSFSAMSCPLRRTPFLCQLRASPLACNALLARKFGGTYGCFEDAVGLAGNSTSLASLWRPREESDSTGAALRVSATQYWKNRGRSRIKRGSMCGCSSLAPSSTVLIDLIRDRKYRHCLPSARGLRQ